MKVVITDFLGKILEKENVEYVIPNGNYVSILLKDGTRSNIHNSCVQSYIEYPDKEDQLVRTAIIKELD